MVRQLIKNAGKPLRPRVEVYAKTDDGKIIAGKYPDGGVGVFGGGVDGDSLESASKKEFREEGGITIDNVKRLKGVKPMVERWGKDHGEQGRKQKMRAKKFSGSKTFFMTADVKGKGKMVDGSKIKGVKPRTVEELIDQQKKAVKNVEEERREAAKMRLAVLQRLREKTAEAIEEEEFRYAPEIYAHEVGHHKIRQRFPTLTRVTDVATPIGSALGYGTGIAGVLTKNPALTAGGLSAATLSDVPRVAEELLASRRALKDMKGRLSEEEYDIARERLRSAAGTYYKPVVGKALSSGLAIAGALSKRPEYRMGLTSAGMLGHGMSNLLTLNRTDADRIGSEKGRKFTGEELTSLHEELAPELGLHKVEGRLPMGAVYFGKPNEAKRRYLEDEGFDAIEADEDQRKKFLESGGIIIGSS